MVSLLLKNIPDRLHEKLKEEAKKHRRSMIQETIMILEERLDITEYIPSKPINGKKLLDQKILTKGIKDGRK